MEDILEQITKIIEQNAVTSSIFFFIVFIGFFLLIITIISRFGWRKFSDKYEQPNDLSFDRIGIISAQMGKASYQNSIVLKANSNGLYFSGLFIFKLGHPSFFIPYYDIETVDRTNHLFGGSVTLHFKDNYLPTIKLKKKTFNFIEQKYKLQF